jgi:SAM-dependent methyltransferase
MQKTLSLSRTSTPASSSRRQWLCSATGAACWCVAAPAALLTLAARAQPSSGLPPQSSALPEPSNKELDTPFVTTPQNVVDAMLELGQVRAGDRLLDLGSGDGRIVITAAKRFGVPGLGVEIDPRLVERARAAAATEGVAGLARFEIQDLFKTDLTQASVITMYLLPDVNELLMPHLRQLKPGTRIVSHDWDMGPNWKPLRSVKVAAPEKKVGIEKSSQLFLWIIE